MPLRSGVRCSAPGRHANTEAALSDGFPARWWRDGCPTTTGIDELVASLRIQLAPGAARTSTDSLTRAERQIAELIADGLSNTDVAATLFVSRRTVETHLTHIFRKLDVRTRTQLAAIHLRATRPA